MRNINHLVKKKIWILTAMSYMIILCACGTKSGNLNESSLHSGLSSEQIYVIKESGEFRFEGEISETIEVDAPGEKVTIILDNAYIQPVTGPAINIFDAEKVIIILASGSENALKDAPYRSGKENDNGCIFSKCDLEISGSGKLNVYGYQNAIRCKDRLDIVDSDISVISKQDGIKANDGITIISSTISAQCEENGILTTKIGKNNKGIISITDSIVDIIAGKYGIESKSDVYVTGSKIYNKSVLGQYNVEGNITLEEGCEVDE